MKNAKGLGGKNVSHDAVKKAIEFAVELCADELVIGGGVGWSQDRRRRRAAHF